MGLNGEDTKALMCLVSLTVTSQQNQKVYNIKQQSHYDINVQ